MRTWQSRNRITAVGAGPGGLYAAILLQAADRSRDVVVYERDAPEDAFGFGVVFSDAALAELEHADAPSYRALLDGCVQWDPVEIRYRGERVRAHGNRFAAVSRRRLLRILQERAVALGVDLRFGTEVTDLARLADAGLVVAADGANSPTRASLAAQFQPTLAPSTSMFIWLGTTKPFDAFTFIFVETEHGLFQAHVYPHEETMSTVIVECTRQTWRRARLDTGATAAGVAYLQDLFAGHLDGHPLVVEDSKWANWTTVRTRTWRHGNVALLGDAAHTAHFSVGSGTKLALQDAVALARAVNTHADVDAALADYERVRRPAVERAQQAADASLDWFARCHRYWGFPPAQFAYSLLTRSNRIDYEDLRRRDPQLLLGLERHFAEAAERGSHHVALVVPTPPALTGITIGGRRLPSRAVLAVPAAALERAAAGGAGLVLVEHVAVSSGGRITPEDAGCYSDAQGTAWADRLATARATAGDALLGVQLAHAGPRGATRPRRFGLDWPLPTGGWPLVAARAQPYGPGSARPRALGRAGMQRVCEEFVAAARRADRAGFDVLELHAGHGYLLASFLSPLTNDGKLAERLAFPLEVVAAVRAVWPKPLSVCFSASDLQRGGLPEDEAVEVARQLQAHGADLVHVVSGQTTPDARPDYDGLFDVRWSDLVRNVAGVRTLVGGGITTASEANHVLAAGKADLCVIGRPAPLEPDWLARQRR